MEAIPAGWLDALADAIASDPFRQLDEFLTKERASLDTAIYPPDGQVFAALRLTPLASVRAVILGQDPYHAPDQATGLAFSVADGCKKPRSLQNILKARKLDLGIPCPPSGSLEQWAQNGVLLLNTALTVQGRVSNSHRKRWTPFTDAVIGAVGASENPVAFLLWGRQAQEMPAVIKLQAMISPHHVFIPSLHPAAWPHVIERRFIDSKPFSRADTALCERGQKPINWSLPGDPDAGSGGVVRECPTE